MPLRILVVDDNSTVRQGICRLLANLPFCSVCAEAGSGAEGIEAAKRENPDVALVDVSMPGMNGFETIGHLRALSPKLFIVLTSQNDAQAWSKAARAQGADLCVDKATLAEDLFPALRSIVSRDNSPSTIPS